MAELRFGPESEEFTKQKVLSSGGEVGALMRAMDWSKTGLGPVTSWPQSLRTAVSICLHSRFELFVWWGPELIMLYNDAYRQTLQSKHPWALGKPGHVVWPEIWPVIGPMLQNVMRTGQATWSDDLLLFLERHGYPEETYHTFSYSPIIDESGGISGVFTAVTQTTEKVIGERRLRTLRDVAARSVDATTESEAWNNVADALRDNPYDLQFAALYRFDAEQEQAEAVAFAGIQPDHPFLTPLINSTDTGFEGCSAWIRETIRTAKGVELIGAHELGFDLPKGAWNEQPAEVLFLPLIQTGQAQPLGVLVTGVSRRKRLDENYRGFFNILSGQISKSVSDAQAFEKERKRAEALAEIDRAKTAFFSNVSHEFRTPLTLMLGPLEDTLAEGPLQLGGENIDRLQTVHRNGMRLLKLVNSLLDFSRIEAGRMQAVYEPVDLALLTGELASVFRSAVERAGIYFRLQLEPVSEPIYVDREMWEKVVLNLISNAFKFTFAGEIRVELRDVGDAVEFSVSDTGTGIPENELPRLFERFHRVEGAKGRSFEGSGIGLALVQELVKLHGGAISVQSSVGEGSTFTVTVPKGKAHLTADRIGARRTTSTGLRADSYVEEASRWIPDSSDAAGLRRDDKHTLPLIVVADDNADMRDYAARLLRSEYRVEVAIDGRQALELVRRLKPDLLLTDVMMPLLDGFGLLAEIRADADVGSMPVIMLSARAGEEARVEGLHAGADDYLVKPFTARELMARVKAHVSMSKIRREAAEKERWLRAEAEAERRKLRELFDQAPAGIGVLSGSNHVWTYVNSRYLQMVSRKDAGQLLNRTIRESLPEIEAQGFVAALDRVYQTGKPHIGTEVLATLADGHGKFRDMYFDFVYQPMRNAEGSVDGVLIHCIEVTERVLGRREVERKQELLRAALVASSTGTFRWDPGSGEFRDFDDNLKALFGISAEQKVQQAHSVVERLYPEDRESFLTRLERCRAGHDFDMDFRVELPHGRIRWLHGRAKMQQNNGTPAHLVGACTDITSTRELAEQLRTLNGIGNRVAAELDQQKLLQLITDAATQGTRAEFGAFFYNVEDAAGGSYMLYTISGVDPAHFSKFPMPRNTAVFAPTFSGEGTVRSANIRHDPRFGHNQPYQGTPPGHLPVVSYLAVPVRGKEGRVIGGLFFGHSAEDVFHESDERFAEAISSHAGVALENSRLYRAAQDELEQRRKVETELEQQRRFLAIAQKSGHIGSWQLDFTTTPIHVTWSEELEILYGIEPGKFGGLYEHWTEAVHPDDREAASRSLRRAIEKQEPWVAEFRIIRPDGEIRNMSARGQGYYDAEGKALRMIGVNIDITERKRAEDALRNSEKLAATGRLAATIAHEINNPLEAVTNFIFLARRNPDMPETAGKQLELADRELERVSHIAQQTLGFYRDTSAPVSVNIRKSVEDVLRLFERKLKYKLLTTNIDVPEDLEIRGLRGEVRQVLSNLLANAIDASSKGGTIRMRARNIQTDTDDFVRISVADGGHGIPSEAKQSIFAPFFTTKKDVGTGLGLWVTKSMVEKHGGRISFRSTEGKGSVFIVTFPKIMLQSAQPLIRPN